MGLDPVCKMEVNPAGAAAQSDYEGQTSPSARPSASGRSTRTRSSISTRPTGPRVARTGPSRPGRVSARCRSFG
jgi:hypothetical protein